MNAFNTVVKFFQDSGLFIYPSILIMALGVAVAIERFIFLNRARADNRRMWDQMLPLLQHGKFDKVQAPRGRRRRGDRQDRQLRHRAAADAAPA